MSRAATGTVKWVEPDASKGETRGHYKIRLSALRDGARPWIHLDPGPKSPEAEQTAHRMAEAWSEKYRLEGKTGADFGIKRRGANAQPTIIDDAEKTEMAKWITTWVDSRKKKGHSATRDNASHYAWHIATCDR